MNTILKFLFVFHLPDDCSISHMTRSKRVQVEQQQHINVEKAMMVLSDHTTPVIVDHVRLMVGYGEQTIAISI